MPSPSSADTAHTFARFSAHSYAWPLILQPRLRRIHGVYLLACYLLLIVHDARNDRATELRPLHRSTVSLTISSEPPLPTACRLSLSRPRVRPRRGRCANPGWRPLRGGEGGGPLLLLQRPWRRRRADDAGRAAAAARGRAGRVRRRRRPATASCEGASVPALAGPHRVAPRALADSLTRGLGQQLLSRGWQIADISHPATCDCPMKVAVPCLRRCLPSDAAAAAPSTQGQTGQRTLDALTARAAPTAAGS